MGISAVQLSRELEIAYSSAWYLLHRLRKAMGERDQDHVLSGIVELDDAYFGAPTTNGKRGRGTEKTSALANESLKGTSPAKAPHSHLRSLTPPKAALLAQFF